MSKGNTFETELLDHIFINTAIPLIGDAGGLLPSAVAGSLFISLHTADPGEAGTQDISEAAYTNYVRVTVGRTSGDWTTAGNTVDNDNNITFPQSGSGPESETFFGVGVASSGVTKLLYSGALTSTLVVNNGITPQFAPGDLNVTED